MALEDVARYNKGLLDFHNHSTYSDGGDTPTELVKRAVDRGVSAMALTDHHGVGGLPEFMNACKKYDILGISFGTEISAELPEYVLTPQDMSSPDLIILGKNPNVGPMKGYQEIYFNDMEKRHLPEVLDGLRSVGFEIPSVDLKEQCASFHCPPDICHSFIDYKDNIEVLKKYVRTKDPEATDEAIEGKPIAFVNRWLYAIGMPAYTSRFKGFDVDDAIGLTEDMNCKLFIAHPGGDYGFLTDRMLSYFITKGVDGIEVRNYFNSEEQNTKFDKLASGYDLIRSGGSDCHGDKGPFRIGCYDKPNNQLPNEILEELWDRLPE
ncbi:PHP domain-containing protein [archaeon]|jgi:3',5'-nucleoside bisphosphate phosphatase|nr:PHP domain-containing protein [archaeon]